LEWNLLFIILTKTKNKHCDRKKSIRRERKKIEMVTRDSNEESVIKMWIFQQLKNDKKIFGLFKLSFQQHQQQQQSRSKLSSKENDELL
jgi:hypothetical protein